MRLALLAPLLPVLAVAFAPLACSSSTTSDDSAVDNDGGDQGDDEGGDTTDGGKTTKDSAPPFTPGAFPGGYPQVPNNGGGVMVNARIVEILPAGETTLPNYGAAFAASATFKAVAAEYGLGTATGSAPIVGGAIGTGQLSTGQIESYITTTLNATANAALRPDGNTIYLIVLPATSWLDYNGHSEQGCHEDGDPTAGGVGGYHVPLPYTGGGNGDGWGVVQHCTGLVDQTDAQVLSIAASHEIIETATDVDGFSGYALPQPQQDQTQTSIWDDLLLTEIGDLCVNTFSSEGAFTYQRFWSNKAAQSSADPCIPAIPTYFNTGTVGGDANGWFKGSPGGTVTIPIEGFSTSAIDPWIVASASGSTNPMQATENGWVMTITGTGTSSGEATIGNGQKGSVTITIPSSATSGGSLAEFELVSAAGIPGENEHLWPFGVYVQ